MHNNEMTVHITILFFEGGMLYYSYSLPIDYFLLRFLSVSLRSRNKTKRNEKIIIKNRRGRKINATIIFNVKIIFRITPKLN